MTTFMLIIIASFIMLASVISTMMVNYYSDASRNRLTSTAEAVAPLFRSGWIIPAPTRCGTI